MQKLVSLTGKKARSHPIARQPLGCSFQRVPDQAEAAGVAGAAAAIANLDMNVNPVGDWTTQAEDPYVGPVGYCLARQSPRYLMSFKLKRPAFSVLYDVPSDICLARPLGAV